MGLPYGVHRLSSKTSRDIEKSGTAIDTSDIGGGWTQKTACQLYSLNGYYHCFGIMGTLTSREGGESYLMVHPPIPDDVRAVGRMLGAPRSEVQRLLDDWEREKREEDRICGPKTKSSW